MRQKVLYATTDGQWMKLDKPEGMVSPPIIEMHVPLQGPVTFYYASCYEIPVPEEAKEEGLL